jgi:hypothetical protein
MTKTPIPKIPIDIYPEMLAEAMKQKIEDAFLIWCMLRGIDKIHSSRGLFKCSSVHKLFAEVFGLKENRCRERFRAGIGIFWREPYGGRGDRNFGIMSPDKVCRVLNFEPMNCAKPYRMKIADFYFDEASRKRVRERMIGLVAAMKGEDKPHTLQDICIKTGLSKSTVLRALQSDDYTYETPNFFIFKQYDNEYDARKEFAKQPHGKVMLVPKDGMWTLQRRIGNSYHTSAMRLAFDRRPNYLKKHNRLSSVAKKVVCVGETFIPEVGTARAWASTDVPLESRNKHVSPYDYYKRLRARSRRCLMEAKQAIGT